MTEECSPKPKHLRWQWFRFHLVSWLFVGIFQLVSAIWMLVKWAIAPIAFVIDILIIMPIAKMMVRMVANPAIEVIEEAEVPDYAWARLEENRHRLLWSGYKEGQWVKAKMSDHQIIYLLSMVHPQLRLGLGIAYVAVIKDDHKDRPSDMTFAEVTLETPDGSLIDLSTMEDPDFLRKVPNRRRLNFSELDVPELTTLASLVSQKTGFVSSEEALEGLVKETPKLMRDEYAAAIGYAQQIGYLTPDDGGEKLKLTWKGAIKSALMTLWPTSVYFKHKEKQAAEAFCTSLGIEQMMLYESEPGQGELAYDQTIKDMEELTRELEQVPLLAGFRPAAIYITFEDHGQIAEVRVEMERHTSYVQRDYVMTTVATINFNNKTLMSDYACSSFDLIMSKEDFELMDRLPLLPSMKGLLPLSRIVALAMDGRDDQNLELSDAELVMGDQGPVWGLSFCRQSPEEFLWVSLNATTGQILEEE